MKKNIWEKPELGVLIRSNPEECVLGACKTGVALPGPQNSFEVCRGDLPSCSNCISTGLT